MDNNMHKIEETISKQTVESTPIIQMRRFPS